jgi:lysophospholipase L1-like esterase
MRNATALLTAVLSFVFAQTVSASTMKTILVLGDSLSDGFQLKRSEAYPALIANKLRDAGLNLQ